METDLVAQKVLCSMGNRRAHWRAQICCWDRAVEGSAAMAQNVPKVGSMSHSRSTAVRTVTGPTF